MILEGSFIQRFSRAKPVSNIERCPCLAISSYILILPHKLLEMKFRLYGDLY